MEVLVAHGEESLEMSLRVRRLQMASFQHSEASCTQAFCVESHGTSMQQQTLTVHLHRPVRIRAKEERILNQRHRPACVQAWVISKQLMRIDNGELQSQPSPARRHARRPMDVA